MKLIHLFSMSAISLSTSLLVSCSVTHQQSSSQTATNYLTRQHVVKTAQENYPQKNPQSVTLYTHDKIPHTAYRIIGVASVAKYNLLGMEREQLVLNNMMKHLAASIGGDGLIDISMNEQGIKGNVIAFQKILI